MAADAKALVLVVDDEPINLRVLAEGLHEDYRVRMATSGEQALAFARGDDPPDLILLDVMMPGLDGYETCRRLKRDAATRDIPVIFVTSLRDEDHETRGLDVGAVDYVVKPFNLRTLCARVRTHMDLKRASVQLAAMSRLDVLTGIANRRAFEDALEREWRRNMRDETPVALIMCDIDHFKRYNDCNGHVAGDRCLRQVAQAIAGAMRRPADLAARFGGEEFVALLTGTDRDGALRVAEEIRERVWRLGIEYDGGERVTVSCGAAATVPVASADPVDLIASADAHLYAAKADGRDRVAG